MFAQSSNCYSGTCSQLSKAIQDIDVKLRMSEQNAKLKANYTEQLSKHENNIVYCNSVLETLKPKITDIQEYINTKREESMQNINNALRLAGEIIPDSEQGIHFVLEDDEAWLATSDDLTVQNTEGGAFRQVSSTFVRSVVLASNPELLQTMFLDEIFAHVSVENTAQLSFYLNVLCQDRQVICIEQKPEIFSNIEATVFTFKKNEKFSEVTKTVVGKEAGVVNNEV